MQPHRTIDSQLPLFGGDTYLPGRDGARLGNQIRVVFDIMRDGKWRTLAQLAYATGGSEAAVSARLRDLRKPKFGSHTVEKHHVRDGLWLYRLELNQQGRQQ